MQKKSVLIAARQHLGFETLRFFLDSQPDCKVVGYVTTEKNLLQFRDAEKPALILMCYMFEFIGGSSYIHRMKMLFPEASIIILSATPRSMEEIWTLYRYGASGFICTTSSTLGSLLEALTTISQSGCFFSPEYLKWSVQNQLNSKTLIAQNSMMRLADREEEVLRMIAEGHSAKAIADLLNISKNTVNVHRRNIMKKLNMHKSVDLTKYAIKNNLIRL